AFGMGYDRTGDGFGLDDGTVFPSSGIVESSTNITPASPLNSLDSYAEGSDSTNGFWAYYVGTSNANPYAQSGSWGSPGVGMTDRILVDGAWDGWSFNPDWL